MHHGHENTVSVSDMVRYLLILIFSAISAGKMGKYEKNKKPNIIFVLADDIGWNEVSWHNKHIKTPFMEVKLIMNKKEYVLKNWEVINEF